MNKRVTIRDVAERAGVSISTVHQALNGKPGVSEATRAQIRRIAGEMGYQPNAMASGLKRRTQRVVALLPGEGGKNRYYYPPLWSGIRDYLNSAADLNVDCTELPYGGDPAVSASLRVDEVRALLADGQVDGLLTVGHMDAFTQAEWDGIEKRGVPVVQIGNDNAKSHSMCCVQPDYRVIGRTMAELLLGHIPSYGSILMCAGNPSWKQHSLIVRGFEEYMEEDGARNKLYKSFAWSIGEESQREITYLLSQPDIAACCSVLSQGSVMMVQALRETGKAGQVFAVGSDLFEENIASLRARILTSIIQKNPYAQGYLGIKTLVEALTQGKQPKQQAIYVGSEVVFRSNVVMYDHGNFRSLLI